MWTIGSIAISVGVEEGKREGEKKKQLVTLQIIEEEKGGKEVEEGKKEINPNCS